MAAGILLGGSAAAQTIGSFPNVAVPPGNAMTPAKIELGKALFFEEQLSSDNTMACATCHLPESGGADPRAGARHPGTDGLFGTDDDEFGSPGMLAQTAAGEFRFHASFGTAPQVTPRNAPTVIGAAFFDSLFWDKRAGPAFRDLAGNVLLSSGAALESQAVAPPTNTTEMAREGRNWNEITAKLARVRPLELARDLPESLERFIALAPDYRPLFERAFGSPGITRERIAMAIASYERTLVADRTPFDLGTMTEQQARGFQVFLTRGICTSCHGSGGIFSDGQLHSIGLPDHPRLTKTPTLRNVGLQRRLTSSGQFRSLGDVVRHYTRAGFFFSPLTPVETTALIEFLGVALTDPRVRDRLPPFDRPTLRSEVEAPGSNQYGQAGPGLGGIAPELLSRSPSNRGHLGFQIGVARGRAGAPVFLALSGRQAAPGTTLLGVPLNIDPQGVELWTAVLSDLGNGHGLATFRFDLPAQHALVGTRSFVQAFVADPAAVGGFSATRGASYELFSEYRRPPLRED
jgi:cytochrome c peroxidase